MSKFLAGCLGMVLGSFAWAQMPGGQQKPTDLRWLLNISPTPIAEQQQINAVVFSPDGRLVVSASDWGAARIFDSAAGCELRSLEHDDSLLAVAMSPDGRLIATGSADQSIRFWGIR